VVGESNSKSKSMACVGVGFDFLFSVGQDSGAAAGRMYTVNQNGWRLLACLLACFIIRGSLAHWKRLRLKYPPT